MGATTVARQARVVVTGLGVSLLTGCATSLATLDTGETLAPTSLAPETSIGLSIPVSTVRDLVTEARDIYQEIQANGEYVPSEEDTRLLLKTIMFSALYPPGAPNTWGFKVGLAPRFNLGVRYNGGFAVNGKFQLVDAGPRDLAVTAEFQHQSFFLNDYLGLFGEDGFETNSGFFQLIYSRNIRDVFKPYIAAKARYSRYHVASVTERFSEILEVYTGQNLGTELDGEVWAVGGGAGFQLGYQYAFVSAELTLMQVMWDATLVGERTSLDGLVVNPAVGLTIIVPPVEQWPDGMKRVFTPRKQRNQPPPPMPEGGKHYP